jgi:hypothetical protein
MTIEMTSVSRRPESLSHAPSATVRMAWTPNTCPDAARVSRSAHYSRSPPRGSYHAA